MPFAVTLVATIAIIFSRCARYLPLIASTTLGPLVAGLYFIIFPLNPYKNIFATSLSGISDTYVESNPAARELIALLRSRRAKWYCLKVAMAICPGLTVLTLALASVWNAIGLSWQPSYPWQDLSWTPCGIFLFAVGCQGVEWIMLVRWARRQWEPTQGARAPETGYRKT